MSENRLSFGRDAAGYRRYRPSYPASLYLHLASLAPDRESALDCATGNGQAAVDLAGHFDEVCACDASAEQIDAAEAHARVVYRVADAEALPYPDDRFSLITVAQGAHWFDLPSFYAEAKRVAKQDAVIAIWGYSYSSVTPEIDSVVKRVLLDAIEPYWAEGNKVIQERYRSIDFPFDELAWPQFTDAIDWRRDEYLRYMSTWSAVKRYCGAGGTDAIAALDRALERLWPSDRRHAVGFEFVGRVGRIR